MTGTLGRRILLVDDDQSLLRNYRWCLEDLGYTISTAGNIASAMALVDAQVFF